jgi:hypothetical protein
MRILKLGRYVPLRRIGWGDHPADYEYRNARKSLIDGGRLVIGNETGAASGEAPGGSPPSANDQVDVGSGKQTSSVDDLSNSADAQVGWRVQRN